MRNKKIDRFNTIFSDASIIDIDFSSWDKYISIWVIADHINSLFDSHRRPVFEIKFLKVTSINFEFRHHENNIFENDDSKNYVWRVDDPLIEQKNDGFFVELMQMGEMPIVQIQFRRFEIEEIPQKILDDKFPNWNDKSNKPLLRPGIKQLLMM